MESKKERERERVSQADRRTHIDIQYLYIDLVKRQTNSKVDGTHGHAPLWEGGLQDQESIFQFRPFFRFYTRKFIENYDRHLDR